MIFYATFKKLFDAPLIKLATKRTLLIKNEIWTQVVWCWRWKLSGEILFYIDCDSLSVDTALNTALSCLRRESEKWGRTGMRKFPSPRFSSCHNYSYVWTNSHWGLLLFSFDVSVTRECHELPTRKRLPKIHSLTSMTRARREHFQKTLPQNITRSNFIMLIKPMKLLPFSACSEIFIVTEI